MSIFGSNFNFWLKVSVFGSDVNFRVIISQIVNFHVDQYPKVKFRLNFEHEISNFDKKILIYLVILI